MGLRSAADPRDTVPASVWVPVAVVAAIVAVAVLWIVDANSGLVPFAVIALALGSVVPVSLFLHRRRGRAG